MALNFPLNPISGQTYSNNGKDWVFNGAAWDSVNTQSLGPQGLQGPQGFQGETGPQGNTGFQGSTGIQGETGPQGFTGDQGVTGPQGTTGPQGFTGIQGETGPQGFTGVQGTTGPQGNTGNQGTTGPQGFTGNQGVTGPQGYTGLQGKTGPQGPAGQSTQFFNYLANTSSTVESYVESSYFLDGYTGVTGYIIWNNSTQISATQLSVSHIDELGNDVDIFLELISAGDKIIIQDRNNSNAYQQWLVSGSLNTIPNDYVEIPVSLVTATGLGYTNFPNGHEVILVISSIGATGPQGPQGYTGDQGITGPQGVTGFQGTTGPQGFTGVQGETGPQGETGLQGTTGPQGFTGGQGETGPQGHTGNQGETGPQGFTGLQGETGPQGFTGLQGETGPQGFTGSQGETGPQGFTGSQGETGPQGFTGPQGETGSQGHTGSQGETGPQGFTGIQGETGPQGSTGPKGNDGQSSNRFLFSATFSTTGDPGPGYLLWNSATQIGATQINISHLDSIGVDIDVLLSVIKPQDTLIIQDRDDSNNYQNFTVNNQITIIPNSYDEVPVIFATSSGTGTSNFSNGQQLALFLFSAGVAGPQGFQGNTGPQGFTGPQGETGLQGATGPLGSSRNDSFTSSTSYNINHGLGFYPPVAIVNGLGNVIMPTSIVHNSTSDYTVTFATSTSGTIITGGGGDMGPQGFQGETGSQGFQGETGPQGFQGGSGPQGPIGDPGGPRGFQGVTGPQGDTGPQGFQGPTGAQGFTGPQGPTGVQGFTGPQGSTGPSGITIGSFGLTIDGGSSVITTGSKGYVSMPYGGSITGWDILGNDSGSISIDLKKSTYTGFPTTTSVTATNYITLTSQQKNTSSTLAGWLSVTFSSTEIYEFYVNSASIVTRVNVVIRTNKTS